MTEALGLQVHLHDRLLGVLDPTRPGLSLLEGLSDSVHLSRLSAAFAIRTTPIALYNWLDGLLPENGHRAAFVRKARELVTKDDRFSQWEGVLPILLANTDVEYPGAVTFRARGLREPQPDYRPRGYEHIDDREVANRLLMAMWRAESSAPRPRKHYPKLSPSLSGQQPKIGLFHDSHHDAWAVPRGIDLTTWVAKVEHRSRFPGEAGVEAICQRAMRWLDVPAATTYARVFRGVQTVLSKRSDRTTDPKTGRIVPVHQEDLSQAFGWHPTIKYEHESPRGPTWKEVYALVRKLGTDPDRDTSLLTRIVVATWAIGHADFHRRNLGFIHSGLDKPFTVRPAPLYDVSSVVGNERYLAKTLSLRIGGGESIPKLKPAHWIRFAHECALDPDQVLAVLTDLTRQLPDAIAEARDRAKHEDENIHQETVDRRIDTLLNTTANRARTVRQSTHAAYRKGARHLDPQVHQLVHTISALDATYGEGAVKLTARRNGHFDVSHDIAGTNESRFVATVSSPRPVVTALFQLGRYASQDFKKLQESYGRANARLS